MNHSIVYEAARSIGMRLEHSDLRRLTEALARDLSHYAATMPTPIRAEAPKTSAELAALAIEAEAAEQVAAEAKARADQLAYQVGLGNATVALLTCIQRMDGGTVEIASQNQFATYRKDLTPLAADYGYKIVLVGDKSKATLSK